MQNKWLHWAQQIQAISQSGLEYVKDVYDKERYEQLRELSVEIMSTYTDVETDKVRELFASETGYATPKVDVRGVVFCEGKLLFVRERDNEQWSLPGGWCDIGYSPTEVAIKEIREESGYESRAIRLLGVCDKRMHNHPPSAFYVYKMFIRCEMIGGMGQAGLETSQVDFFGADELPELSVDRNTVEQIMKCMEYWHDPTKEAFCD